jgi:hypothetical protein
MNEVGTQRLLHGIPIIAMNQCLLSPIPMMA